MTTYDAGSDSLQMFFKGLQVSDPKNQACSQTQPHCCYYCVLAVLLRLRSNLSRCRRGRVGRVGERQQRVPCQSCSHLATTVPIAGAIFACSAVGSTVGWVFISGYASLKHSSIDMPFVVVFADLLSRMTGKQLSDGTWRQHHADHPCQ